VDYDFSEFSPLANEINPRDTVGCGLDRKFKNSIRSYENIFRY